MRRLVLILALTASLVHAKPFELDDAVIVHADQPTMRLAAGLLARDVERVSGRAPASATRLQDCPRRCIIVGTADSALVKAAAQALGADLKPLAGQSERYLRVAGEAGGRALLLVAGSDRRGAVYGVVDMSRELGVSAWEWWADVAPAHVDRPAVDGAPRLSNAPSVAYRGIFINDEDWGLQPWAAKTFDPAGDIGPKTYARVFELLWRLKANLVWPAMHESTRPFYSIPGNARTADDYAIIVGTSHAEPMMRNNVGEWKSGPFDWFRNRDRLVDYWRTRIEEVKHTETITSLGLRGVHDSAMEGAASPEQARDTLQDVFRVQRAMLGEAQGKPPERIPQAFTMYKEVLDYWNLGLAVPDDVTLVWPDDNYGYLAQLGTDKEGRRAGGQGIYYHVSYWGRPHDYLWLGTTHPSLIRDQLERAWATGARRLWVLNVGDIKPAEYLTQYFLDAAFDADVLKHDPARHLEAWAAAQFGPGNAREAAAILGEYYRLAWERRPEFMGWSQTEPTRPVRTTAYVRTGGDEAERRLADYRALTARAESLAARIPAPLRDAYFELVLYPVRSSANLNTRILKLDLAAEYARQQRPSSNLYVRQARAAHAALVADAAAYEGLAGGKWRGIMDIVPRRLPVFAEPAYPTWSASRRRGCGIVYPDPFSVDGDRLVLRRGRPATRTVTLVSYGGQDARWSVRGGAHAVQANADGGMLDAANGHEQRITLRYDGGADPALSLQCGEDTVNVRFGEGGIVVLRAGAATPTRDWTPQPGLGTSGSAMRARLDLPSRTVADLADLAASAPLVYRFATAGDGETQLRLVAVPEHPLTAANRVRFAVSLDGGAPEVVDTTTAGRSEQWKEDVLSNMAVRTWRVGRLAPGMHTLTVHALDPGIVLDRIDVVPDGAPDHYGMPPGD
ncbi:glycosyl hydrolase 115 family protein [Telluria mixta]|uniref:Glycosyl hydrolase 115 family protein n=1 Tax=Telluria mixta TaxID=34071 RepID=A0ABT2C984_9BURK|nr:glycosyl hydrolase 115 family protein [Telluria mixta]MCS0633929.1 glycosyl hydrolase 115 family protein [Telluria mixta]WEM95543.1 glycosyl hydrolase 115 family protein [Telluria mixta]